MPTSVQRASPCASRFAFTLAVIYLMGFGMLVVLNNPFSAGYGTGDLMLEPVHPPLFMLAVWYQHETRCLTCAFHRARSPHWS